MDNSPSSVEKVGEVAPEKVASPPPTRTSRKIAILGTAQTSVFEAPYNDPSWKIWDMSANFQYGHRHDIFFEIHTPEMLIAAKCPQQYLDFLKKSGKGLMVFFPSEEYWPEATIFPLQAFLEWAGNYFTCTAAYMIAFALYLHEQEIAQGGPGVSEVGLWGIDMAVDDEYSHQKPCVEYWVGRLQGRGIAVKVAPQSPICRVFSRYAVDNQPFAREMTEKLKEIQKALQERQAGVAQANKEIIELLAIEKELKSICTRWAL